MGATDHGFTMGTMKGAEAYQKSPRIMHLPIFDLLFF
jgi:hypothetical protein